MEASMHVYKIPSFKLERFPEDDGLGPFDVLLMKDGEDEFRVFLHGVDLPAMILALADVVKV